jgi:hypothetical protein
MIGYDVRWFPPDFLSSRWTPSERARTLLRPELARPASTDTNVWPSRFKIGEVNDRDLLSVDPVTGDPHVLLFGLWSSVGQMLAHYRPAQQPDYAVGFRLYTIPGSAPQDEWWRAIHGTAITPTDPDAKWGRLGFDVSNSGLTSALSGIVMLNAELDSLRRQWALTINDFGLFESAQDAILYCKNANERLREEGPFYVWELFLLWGDL